MDPKNCWSGKERQRFAKFTHLTTGCCFAYEFKFTCWHSWFLSTFQDSQVVHQYKLIISGGIQGTLKGCKDRLTIASLKLAIKTKTETAWLILMRWLDEETELKLIIKCWQLTVMHVFIKRIRAQHGGCLLARSQHILPQIWKKSFQIY